VTLEWSKLTALNSQAGELVANRGHEIEQMEPFIPFIPELM